MNSNQIQRCIRKREDKSFVVIYELLFSNSGVESSSPISLQNLKKEDLIFNPHIPQIEGSSFNRALLSNQNKHLPYEYGSITKGTDIMVQVYPYSAKQMISGIYACLEKFNTVIKVKSADYKLKCYHKNMIKMTKYNSSMELFNEFSKVWKLNLC